MRDPSRWDRRHFETVNARHFLRHLLTLRGAIPIFGLLWCLNQLLSPIRGWVHYQAWIIPRKV